MQMALQEFNMHLVPEIFGQAPDGVKSAVFLGGVARCGKLGSKREQIEVLLRAFVGSASGAEKSQQEERSQSGNTASTSARSSAPAESRGSEKSAKTVFSRERLEGILLALWYLTASNRRRDLFHDGSKKGDPPEASHQGVEGEGQKEVNRLQWPDLRPLLNGAISSQDKTGEPSSEKADGEPELSLDQVLGWAVATLPGLSDILEPFLVRRCGAFSKSVEGSKPEKETGEEAATADTAGKEKSPKSQGSSDLHKEMEAEGEGVEAWKPGMLSTGLAWGMGLALSSGTAKWGVGPRLIDLGCGGGDLTRLVGRPRLLYK
jgi:hypothetical protein